jgi:recombination DNA repair RAD52 pathway protein
MSRIIKLFEGFKEDYMRDLEAAKQQVINVKESYKSKVESYLEDLKKAYEFDSDNLSKPTESLKFEFSFTSNLIEYENVKSHLLKRYKIVNMANDITEVGDKIESELGLKVRYKFRLYIDYENDIFHGDRMSISSQEFKEDSKVYSQPWTNKDVIYKVMGVDLEITE